MTWSVSEVCSCQSFRCRGISPDSLRLMKSIASFWWLQFLKLAKRRKDDLVYLIECTWVALFLSGNLLGLVQGSWDVRAPQTTHLCQNCARLLLNSGLHSSVYFQGLLELAARAQRLGAANIADSHTGGPQTELLAVVRKCHSLISGCRHLQKWMSHHTHLRRQKLSCFSSMHLMLPLQISILRWWCMARI